MTHPRCIVHYSSMHMHVPDDRVNLCSPSADLTRGWQGCTTAPRCHFSSAAQLNGRGTDFLTPNPSTFNIWNVCGRCSFCHGSWSKLVHIGSRSARNKEQNAAMFNLTSTSVCVTDETIAAVLTASEGSVKPAWRSEVIRYCLWMLFMPKVFRSVQADRLVHFFACLLLFVARALTPQPNN